MKFGVTITGIEQVRAQFAQLGGAAERALAATAVKVEEYIDTQVTPHNKTHTLERSLGKERTPGGWEIGHNSRVAPYARFVHDGTKPHVILPRHKKKLRWAAGGRFIFSKGVKHPGNKPDKWMSRAAALAPIIFRAQLEAQIARLTKA